MMGPEGFSQGLGRGVENNSSNNFEITETTDPLMGHFLEISPEKSLDVVIHIETKLEEFQAFSEPFDLLKTDGSTLAEETYIKKHYVWVVLNEVKNDNTNIDSIREKIRAEENFVTDSYFDIAVQYVQNYLNTAPSSIQ